MRPLALLALAAVCSGCGVPPTQLTDLVFLTRDGCGFSDAMRANLDQALQGLHARAPYQVIDLSTLKAGDPRLGYPTPTLLRDGRDVFGMPAPTPPFPEPT